MKCQMRKIYAMNYHYSKINKNGYSLGDLVEIVSSCARNSREALAAIIDLFESGRVRLNTNGRLKKVRVG